MICTLHRLKIVITLCFLSLVFFSEAHTLLHSTYLDREYHAVNEELELEDPFWNEPFNAPPLSHVISRRVMPVLVYGREDRSDIAGTEWSYRVSYTLFDEEANEEIFSDQLMIRHRADDGIYEDIHNYFSNSGRVRLLITSIEASADDFATVLTDPTEIEELVPDDIRLELRLEVTRHDRVYALTSPNLEEDYDASNHNMEVRWDFVEGAEYYELEWAYIDEYNINYDIYGLPQNEEEIFKNATRVEAYGQHFNISVTYPSGHLYYRVRPVGVFIENVNLNYTHLNFGSWQAKGPVLLEGFQEDFNWQYTNTFAEEGKYKKVINYFDDGFKNRQTQTNLSPEKTTLVATAHYDVEGRPVINVLPVPAIGNNDLFYKPKFNRSAVDDKTYNREHFDSGLQDLCANTPPDALSTSLNSEGLGGAAYYFSPVYGNDVTSPGIHKAYLPDAEGYPMAQLRYLNDGTGRLAYKGGVGDFYQVGNGKETRYFYDDPSEMQLRRLFGNNVGAAKYYKRNIVLEPNGQMSVSYIDEVGKVVATALTGVVPTNVNAIESAATSEILITENLMDNNTLDSENGVSTTISTVLNEQVGLVADFTYTFTGVNNTVEVNGTSGICVSCIYELSIDVYSPCGIKETIILDGDLDGDGKVLIGDYEICDQVLENRSYPFSITMSEIGLYRIEKVLRVIQPDANAIQEIIEEYLPTSEDIVIPINYLECADDCNSYCTLSLGGGATQAQIDACIANCEQSGEILIEGGITNSCDYLLNQMLSQISPEGCLFMGQTPWWTPISGTLSNPIILPVSDGADLIISTQSDAEDFLLDEDLWEDGWDEAAVILHPEYCHYLLCTGSDPSRQFDYDFARMGTWTGNGGNVDWIDFEFSNVLEVLNTDPMFTTEGFYINFQTNTELTTGMKSDIADAVSDVISNNSGNTLKGVLQNRLIFFQKCSASDPIKEDIVDYINVCLSAAPTSLTNEEKWRVFKSLYLGEKLKLQNELRAGNDDVDGWCPSGTGACSLTEDSELYDVPSPDEGGASATQDAINDYINGFNNGTAVDVCGVVCEIRVEEWLGLILLDCPNISEADQNTIRQTFMTHCENNCGSENPLGYPLEEEGFDNLSLPPIECDNNISNPLDAISVSTVTVYEEYCQINSCLAETIAALSDFIATGGPSPCNITVSTCWGDMMLTNGTLITTDSPQACCSTFNIWTVGVGEGGASGPADLCDYTSLGVPYIENGQIYFEAYANGTTTLLRIFCGGIDYNLESEVALGSPQDNCFECYLIPIIETEPPVDCEALLETENMILEDYVLNETINTMIAEVVQDIDCDGFEETFTVSYPTREHHYTLYYYDQAGNLVQTVPPAGVNPLDVSAFDSEGNWNPNSTPPNHEQEIRYRYNTLGQVVWQYSPDGGEVEFKYDYAQRLRLAQNGRQRINVLDDDPNNNEVEKLSYTKYDGEGRIIEVGELRNLTSGLTFENIEEEELNDPEFPTLTDGQQWDVTETEYNTIATGGGFVQEYTRSRVSRTFRHSNQRTAFTDAAIETRYSYDEHGNVKSLWHNIDAMNGRTQKIDYDYDLISGNVKEVAYQRGKVDEFYHRYEYDANNRLTNVYTSDDGGAWDRDACYQYYMHGPMARMEIGHDKVQGSDFYYTLQGWVKGANMPGNKGHMVDPGEDGYQGNHGLIGRDAMAYGVGYYDGDYNPIGGGVNLGAMSIATWTGFEDDLLLNLNNIKGLYNGNISWMLTDIPSQDETEFSNEGLRGMVYQYDQLHRIIQAKSYGNTPNSNSGVDWVYDGYYDTQYTYDPNGNLMSLGRNTFDDGQAKVMDNLTYNYTDAIRPNKLVSLSEGMVDVIANDPSVTGQGDNNYVYDDIGNLIRNEQDDVDIEWDVYGKVKEITFNSFSTNSPYTSIRYTYDAMGNRLSKNINHAAPDLSSSTYYVRDASGNILSVYTSSYGIAGVTYRQKEVTLYGSARLGQQKFFGSGRVIPDPNDPVASSVYLLQQRSRGRKIYECSNHLGNVLTVVSDKKLGFEINDPIYLDDQAEYYLAAIVSTSDYYPFGFQMPSRTIQSNNYRYGFNGKEKDQNGEWGSQTHYDYGFRIYNPGIGKFLSVDPLFKGYAYYTPYQFAGNKPITAIDLDGLEEEHKFNIYKAMEEASKPGLSQAESRKVYKETLNQLNPFGNLPPETAVVGEIALGFTPVGWAIDAKDLYVAYSEGDGWGIVFAGVGFLPLVGDIAKGARKAYKAGRKIEVTADQLKKLDDVDLSKSSKVKLCGCFSSGTLIKTDSGEKNIENIVVGDQVWAYNDTTGVQELKVVTEIYTREHDEIYKVYTGNEVIQTTQEHPFYVNGQWVKAEDLNVGDKLQLFSGKMLLIDSIEIIHGSYQVYNFAVDEFHSYYVGHEGILVHNLDCVLSFKNVQGSVAQAKSLGKGNWVLSANDGWKKIGTPGLKNAAVKMADFTKVAAKHLGVRADKLDKYLVTMPGGKKAYVVGNKRVRLGQKSDGVTKINLETKDNAYSWEGIDEMVKKPETKKKISQHTSNAHINIAQE